MKQCLCGRSKTYPYCDETHKTKKNLPIEPANVDSQTDIKSQMAHASDTGQVLFLKNFMKESPGWDDFVKLIDHQYNNPLTNENTDFLYKERVKEIKTPQFIVNKSGTNTNIQHFQNLSLEMWFVRQIGTGFDKHNWYNNHMIDNFVSFFHRKESVSTLKCLINFAGNELNGNIHSDYQDVVSWTCAGEVEYRIYKINRNFERNTISDDEAKNFEYDAYIMTPGDVIYMPKGTYHKAICHKPRASIILDYD